MAWNIAGIISLGVTQSGMLGRNAAGYPSSPIGMWLEIYVVCWAISLAFTLTRSTR
jgi:hypothetical protein